MPIGSRGSSSAAIEASARAVAGPVAAPGPTARARARAARDGSRITVSTRLFHVPHVRHWPSHRRKASPQFPQT